MFMKNYFLAASSLVLLVSSSSSFAQELATRNSSEPIAAVVGSTKITYGDVDAILGNRLLRILADQYRLRQIALEEIIGKALLELEAHERHMEIEELRDIEIARKSPPVTDDEVQQTFQKLGPRATESSSADAMIQIRQTLERQHLNARRAEFLGVLRGKIGAQIFLEPVHLNIAETDAPNKGAAKAPISLVIFSDFECPFCGRSVELTRKLESRYGEQLRIVFRNFPLPTHRNAQKAAEAGSCANEQEHFWEMHDVLFENQNRLETSDLKRYAVSLGLDSRQFDACLDSSKYAGKWKADLQQAREYGIMGVPTFFINGRPVMGMSSYEEMSQIIDDELVRRGAQSVPVHPGGSKTSK
jgi:protein-disulfide isomerase